MRIFGPVLAIQKATQLILCDAFYKAYSMRAYPSTHLLAFVFASVFVVFGSIHSGYMSQHRPKFPLVRVNADSETEYRTKGESYQAHDGSVLEFLLAPNCAADLNAADFKGVSPLHLAATICEGNVRWLLGKGADVEALTLEGQSALHVASRARQSNIVGLLADLYLSKGLPSFVDRRDDLGRTPLFYASRSGRVESVSILLCAGASPNISDCKGMTPLDACAEFAEEDWHWRMERPDRRPKRFMDATFVTLDDASRPKEVNHSQPSSGMSPVHGISSEDDTVGIRQIIRLLLRHGAAFSNKANEYGNALTGRRMAFKNEHLEIARASGCEILVDELLQNIEKAGQAGDDTQENNKKKPQTSPSTSYREQYLCMKPRRSHELLDNIPNPTSFDSGIFDILLRTEDERGVLKYCDLWPELLLSSGHCGALESSIRWGYADILALVGLKSSAMNARTQAAVNEKANPSSYELRPLLHLACERKLPNLGTIKVLVEELHVDVNAVDETSSYGSSHSAALHLLAGRTYWWTAKAIDYLIDHNANIDVQAPTGCTPLRIAVQNKAQSCMETLLSHGANPNILGNDGLSCLNVAGSAEVTRLLLDHGASPTAGEKTIHFRCY